jgi:hypothetical protein
MRPKRPKTELKISMTRILTNLYLGINTHVYQQYQQGEVCSQRWVGGIGKGSATAVDTDSNTADQVAQADRQASPEQRKASVIGIGRVQLSADDVADLGGEDDGHDDAVDGDDFAEDDGDEVLRSDARRLDTSAEDG